MQGAVIAHRIFSLLPSLICLRKIPGIYRC